MCYGLCCHQHRTTKALTSIHSIKKNHNLQRLGNIFSDGHFHKHFRKPQIPRFEELRSSLRICTLIIWCKFVFAVPRIGKFDKCKPILTQADRNWKNSDLEMWHKKVFGMVLNLLASWERILNCCFCNLVMHLFYRRFHRNWFENLLLCLYISTKALNNFEARNKAANTYQGLAWVV